VVKESDPRGREEEPVHGYVASIKRFMTHDGPGIRTTVFLKGCPLRCRWCSSPQTWSPEPRLIYRERSCIQCLQCVAECPEEALTAGTANNSITVDRGRCTGCGRCVEICPSGALGLDGTLMSVEQVVEVVVKDQPYYRKSGGGVTLSGGEPAGQPEFVREILHGCREVGIHTAVETTGCAGWEELSLIVPFVDLLLYDMKHMDPVRHTELTGRDNGLILRNLERCRALDHLSIVVHVPLIPGCNDDQGNLDALMDFLERLGLAKVSILPFHKLGLHEYEELGISWSLEDRSVPGREEIKRIEKRMVDRGFEIIHW
jgi:pyruvate formate lyase activating enzyme